LVRILTDGFFGNDHQAAIGLTAYALPQVGVDVFMLGEEGMDSRDPFTVFVIPFMGVGVVLAIIMSVGGIARHSLIYKTLFKTGKGILGYRFQPLP
jgi:hypothetical protein